MKFTQELRKTLVNFLALEFSFHFVVVMLQLRLLGFFFLISVGIALAAPGDTSSVCVPPTSNSALNSCGNGTALTANEWTEQTVNAGSNYCSSFDGTSSDDDNVFVFAVRPGSDAAGPYEQVRATLFANNTAFGCGGVQPGQTKNQMDFHCYALSATQGGIFVTLTNPNATDAATLDVYVGYSEGSVAGCSAGYVDE